MKRTKLHRILAISLVATMLVSCNDYNALLKTQDYDYRYDAAKQAYVAGNYTRSSELLTDMLMVLKGSDRAEESLMLMGMNNFRMHDYETAVLYFDRIAKTYPKGTYTELARYYSGRANYLQSPDPRLDQTATYTAINTLQQFLELYPTSKHRDEVSDMIFQLQDRLVQKEFDAAQLYYNLGTYVGNCTNGGSNFEACIITAENALKSYPYTNLRENLYMLILRARYGLAQNSVPEKAEERYRATIDEYYGFRNEFPNSDYIEEADRIFKHSNEKIKG